MKKTYLATILGLSLSLFSCKEQLIMPESGSEILVDTTYVTSVEAPQAKKFLIEEFSGVECVNCPEGTDYLAELNDNGSFKDRLIITSIHAGSLTRPIKDKSVQDFRTEDGKNILNNIIGGEFGKPTAAFDRLKISNNTQGKGILGTRDSWDVMLERAMAAANTTPINIHLSSTYNTEEKYYIIEVKIAYTQAVTGRQALTLYLVENNIDEYQLFPSGGKEYNFDHLFRKSITPFNGIELLPEMGTKEEGRVVVKSFKLIIDPSDANTSHWKESELDVIGFIYNYGDPAKLNVIQANSISLK